MGSLIFKSSLFSFIILTLLTLINNSPVFSLFMLLINNSYPGTNFPIPLFTLSIKSYVFDIKMCCNSDVPIPSNIGISFLNN